MKNRLRVHPRENKLDPPKKGPGLLMTMTNLHPPRQKLHLRLTNLHPPTKKGSAVLMVMTNLNPPRQIFPLRLRPRDIKFHLQRMITLVNLHS